MRELQEHRLVLFAGPSSGPSIREFFIQHATNGEDREDPLDSLTNWTWPYHPRANDVNAFADLLLGDKSAPSFVAIHHQDRRRELLATLLAVWGHARTDPERHDYEHYLIPYDVNNVFLGHEEWARFGETPLTKLNGNGMDAIQTVLDLLQPKDFLIVVTHAAKLSEQWLSLVEPFTKFTFHSYRDFMCSAYTSWDQGSIRVFGNAHFEYANSMANPLGLVVELRKHGWPVALVDLEGVEMAGLDPAHVIGCEILNVPCHEGWIKGLPRQQQQPSAIIHPQAAAAPATARPTSTSTSTSSTITGLNLNLSQAQLDEIEWIFRQRDCMYRHYHLLDDTPDTGVQILRRGKSLWADCSKRPTEWQRNLLNTTMFLDELYAQVGCSSSSSSRLPTPQTVVPSDARIGVCVFAFLILVVCSVWLCVHHHQVFRRRVRPHPHPHPHPPNVRREKHLE
jgi:hypothetical protein